MTSHQQPNSTFTLSILEAAKAVLTAQSLDEKCHAAFTLGDGVVDGSLGLPCGGDFIPLPERPARPKKPELKPPSDMKRRRLGTQAGRAALLHAIAHIEFNAIDLAADMVARFSPHPFIEDNKRASFITDWARVCHDEARHFSLIRARLNQLGMQYGDLPAHDGLWQAAEATSGNITARLVIAPMVLEARGLDVTPAMIAKLKAVGDFDSAAILQVIYDDEIGHVGAGSRWFSHICSNQALHPRDTFHEMVRNYFHGLLKPPFNRAARDLAGMPIDYYEPLSLRNSPV